MGFQRKCNLKPHRLITVLYEDATWIVATFFDDKCHRIWLVNKEYELYSAVSSSDEEYEFDFYYDDGPPWNGSSYVVIDPNVPFEEQLKDRKISTKLFDNEYHLVIE
jgi:hypothetical protein